MTDGVNSVAGSLETDATVMVVGLSPVLAITVEPGDEIHLHAGGQGFWVAGMRGRLGQVAMARRITIPRAGPEAIG